MPNRQIYDIHAEWDDPYDRPPEHRKARRCAARFVIKVALESMLARAPLVGPSVVKNISTQGIYFLTKHRLTPGQQVKLRIPTREVPGATGLPEAFMGGGRVVRVEAVDNKRSHVAVRLHDGLANDVDWAVFVDFLESMAPLQSNA